MLKAEEFRYVDTMDEESGCNICAWMMYRELAKLDCNAEFGLFSSHIPVGNLWGLYRHLLATWPHGHSQFVQKSEAASFSGLNQICK